MTRHYLDEVLDARKERMQGDLTAVSLCAGIGGIDLALERSGVRVVAAVEIDPACRSILRRHFPDVAIFNDLTEVTGAQLRAAGFVPGRGIVAAGWPCQGNSVAGRRGGMADPRSGLWRHVVRLLDETCARWFLGENVPGLLSVNGGRDFGTVIGDLDDLGYGLAWRVLDAQWFGVPQRRRRVFIAGCLGDPARPVEVLLEPESGDGHPAPREQARPGSSPAAGGSAVATLQGGGRRGHRVDAEGAAGGHLVAMPVALRGREDGSAVEAGDPGDPAFAVRTPAGGSSYPMIATFGGEGVVHPLTAEGADASEDGTGRGTPIVAIPMAFNPQTGGSKARLGYSETPTALTANQITAVHIPGDTVGFAENQRGELVESAVSYQLTTGGGKPGQGYPAVRAGTAVRRLTPLECERLQGFPDNWTRWLKDGSEQTDSARYRQAGNSVAVPCVEWITRRLVAADSRLVAHELGGEVA